MAMTTVKGTVLYALAFLTALPSSEGRHSRARLVYEYPKVGTWIENGAVRSNGSILLTSINNPAGLSTINPFDGSKPIQLLTNVDFGYLNSTLGIVETTQDVFYVVASNYSLDPVGTQPGTNAIYKVDFTNPKAVTSTLLTRVPKAKFFNGLTKFNNTLLLAADSALGAVWSINTITKEAKVVLKSPYAAPKPSVDGGFKEGINGLHTRNNTLYFTDSNRMTFSQVKFNADGEPAGPVTHLATPYVEKGLTPNWDDFTVDAPGEYAYVATERGNSVQRISLINGHVILVAGGLNSTLIAEPTSVVAGRTPKDLNTVYALTAGALAFPVHTRSGLKSLGAQIVAVDVSWT